jgi:predicted dehydrogenase
LAGHDQRERIDVISIATAPLLRSEPLRLAVDHGRHVLVDKPMSNGVPEAADMVAAAEASTAASAIAPITIKQAGGGVTGQFF